VAEQADPRDDARRGTDLRRSLPGIASLFDRVRAGLRARSALRGVEAALVAGMLYAMVGLVLDRVVLLSASLRYWGMAGLAAVVGVVLLARLASSTAGRIGPLYLAARVEQRYPGLRGRLISAVEMAEAGGPAEGATALVYAQAERLAPEVDVAKVVSGELERTGVHKALLGAMALTLATALAMGERFPTHATRCMFPWLDPAEPDAAFARIWPDEVRVPEGRAFFINARVAGDMPHRVTLVMDIAGKGERSIPMRPSRGAAEWTADVDALEGSGSWRVAAEFASGRAPLVSESFAATLLVVPRAGGITADYSYPGYSGRPPSSHEGGAIDALVGTTVTLAMRPNTPLASAHLNVAGGGGSAMSREIAQDGGEVWRASFRVRRPGAYTIDLVSAEGIENRSGAYPIVARGDAEPSCDAVYEARAPGDAVSLGARFRITAADDLGLRELTLVVKRGKADKRGRAVTPGRDGTGGKAPVKPGAVAFCIDVPGFEPGGREADIVADIPPQLLPLEAGATYTYYVRAADGYGPPPHLVTSDPRTFRVDEPEPEGLLAQRERKKKKRPPLLEPRDDTSRPPPSGGAGGDPPPPPRKGSSPPPPGRRLAGLQDPPGSAGSPPPPRGGKGKQPGEKPKPSRYANESGLQGDQKEGDQGKGDQNNDGQGGGKQADSGAGKGGSGGGGKGGGQPQLPGEGAPRGGGSSTASSGGQKGGGSGGRPKAGQPGDGSGKAPGGGKGKAPGGGKGKSDNRVADSGGSRPGSGGGNTPLPEGSDSGKQPGGGGRNTGLPRKTPSGGGMPDGSEKGGGPPPGPETVDKDAVAALDDIEPDEIASTSVPDGPRPRNGNVETEPLADAGFSSAGRTDLGTGKARDVGLLAGADRITIPRDELPSMEVVRARPVSRAYRALVGEYMRRLRELSE